LLLDAQGNLYGTTTGGGARGAGTVYELSPQSDGTWKEQVLYSFGSPNDASAPQAGLVRDSQGNFFGTTTSGGGKANGGTVFELSPDGSGGWAEKVLFSFPESGAGPYGSLIMDKNGSLYGTTFRGGTVDGGTAFKLSQSGGVWQEQILHSFGDLFGFGDGSEPIAGLTAGVNGHLYGVTLSGGTNNCFRYPFGCGTVFELAPKLNGTWNERVIYNFSGSDGFLPYGQLIFDKAGNLYGTTEYGGNAGGCIYDQMLVNCGTAFELSPMQGGGWTEKVLMNFDDKNLGGQLSNGLLLDAAGNLYGTSPIGGPNFAGLVFEILP